LLCLVVGLSAAPPVRGAEGGTTIEEVRARLQAQGEKVKSLHIRICRQAVVAADPGYVGIWPGGPSPQTHAGMDEVLEAYKGDKRYRRVMELAYSPPPFGPAAGAGRGKDRWYLDSASAWTGTALLERDAGPGSGREDGGVYRPRFEYRVRAAGTFRDAFPPSSYLAGAGLAFPDPAAGSDEARRNLQQMANLSELLSHWPYAIARQAEAVDGVPCLVLEGSYRCVLPLGESARPEDIADKIWLDPGRGLAVRRREIRIGGRFTRVVNRDLVEVSPGLWMPGRSELEGWAASDAAGQPRGKPVLVRRMRLLFWVVNEVPDDIFDVALAPPESPPPSSGSPLSTGETGRPGRSSRGGRSGGSERESSTAASRASWRCSSWDAPMAIHLAARPRQRDGPAESPGRIRRLLPDPAEREGP
jgi:hypothetical protein